MRAGIDSYGSVDACLTGTVVGSCQEAPKGSLHTPICIGNLVPWTGPPDSQGRVQCNVPGPFPKKDNEYYYTQTDDGHKKCLAWTQDGVWLTENECEYRYPGPPPRPPPSPSPSPSPSPCSDALLKACQESNCCK